MLFWMAAEDMMKQMMSGKMTLRLFRDQYSQVASMGSMSQIMGMIPGLSQMSSMFSQGGADQATQKKFTRYSVIMDSMTDAELDLDLEHVKVRGEPGGMPVHVGKAVEFG